MDIYNEVVIFDSYAKKSISDEVFTDSLDLKLGEKQKSVIHEINRKRRELITEVERQSKASEISKEINKKCHEILRSWDKIAKCDCNQIAILPESSILLYNYVSNSDISDIMLDLDFILLANIREFFQLLLLILNLNTSCRMTSNLTSLCRLLKKKQVRIDYANLLESIYVKTHNNSLPNNKFIKNCFAIFHKIYNKESVIKCITKHLTYQDVSILVSFSQGCSWLIPRYIDDYFAREIFTELINKISNEFRRSKK